MAMGAKADAAPPDPDCVVEVRGGTVRFGAFTAVDRVDLTVGPGEVFGLLGPNGSGKTTLIRALCGLIGFAEGRAFVFGRDVAADAERIRVKIGYMSQKFSLYQDLTAQENMDFYAGIYGLPAPLAKARKEYLIALTGIDPYLHRQTAKLSGGWKQRLAMVCALIHNPRLVFLDEPTAGVDPVARRELWDLLFRLAAEGITLFVTTHYMDEAERCARVGYIYMGKMLALGRPKELKALEGVTPPGCKWLEITGGESTALLEELRTRPGVRDATLFGVAIHALVEADRSLQELGLADPALHVMDSAPTLEDVFVTLSKAQERQAAGAP
jgi:ABC-2 type transport system ATP-binding protein